MVDARAHLRLIIPIIDEALEGELRVERRAVLRLLSKRRTVQRGALRAFPAPPYFPGHRSLHLLGRALADFEAAPSALGLAKVGYFAVRS